MRGIRCAVAAVLAAGIVTVVTAQPGGGFGGFGGGQDISTLVLTNTALQEDLKLTADQKAKLKPAADKQAELTKKQREMFGGGGKKGEFDKEKFTELQEEGKKVAEGTKKALDETLTDAQKKRIKQISVQRMGVNVFAEPTEEGKGGKGGKGGFGGFGGQSEAQKATMKEVAEALKLTDGQKSKVKDILSEHGKDLRAIRTDIFGEAKGGFGKAPDPEKTKDFTAKSTKLSAETMGKIAEVLDDTQKKTWKELVGEPFDLAKLQPMIPRKD